jgi:hypothetical protein
LLAGGIVASAAVGAVVLGVLFGLELESYALIGVAMGAVVALVPDARPGLRFAGFAVGVVIALAGYLARAAVLPDAASGRAVAAFAVLALCAVVAAATAGRVPLWATLLGAATFFGAYEASFAAAPPEVASTSLTALTAVAFTAALGFLVATLVAPAPAVPQHRAAGPYVGSQHIETEIDDRLSVLDASFDDLLHDTKEGAK